MKVYQTSKLRVHTVEWPALVRLAAIETALQDHGNIRGSGFKNGIPCYIQAGTVAHMDNYFDYSWVHRTPLPMGLHCQSPLGPGAKVTRGDHRPHPQVQPPVHCLMTSFPLQKPPTQWSHGRREANPNVLAFFNRPETRDSRPKTHDSRLVTRCLQPGTHTLMLHTRLNLMLYLVVLFLYSFLYIVKSKFGDYATLDALTKQHRVQGGYFDPPSLDGRGVRPRPRSR